MIAVSNMRRVALGALACLACVGISTAASAGVLSLNSAPYTIATYGSFGEPITTTAPTIYGGAGDGLNFDDWAVYDIAFWTATTTFNASSTDLLTITDLSGDDAVAVLLNGNVIAAAGIENNGTGNGQFVFTPGGPSVAQTFSNNGDISNASPVVVSGLLSGANTLQLIINNTFDGINDDCNDTGSADGLCGFNPTNVNFAATFGPVAVPEPATWAVMLLGGFGIGFAARGLRRKGAATA